MLTLLQSYAWPGNIRELKNTAERMVVFGGDPLTADQVPPSLLGDREPTGSGLLDPARLTPFLPLKQFRKTCEKEYLEAVLTQRSVH